MVQRITYRRRLAWNTSSNQRRISKTPGGKLVFLYTGKRGTVAKCGDTGKALQGVKAHRPTQLQPGRTTRRAKTVSRAYFQFYKEVMKLNFRKNVVFFKYVMAVAYQLSP